MITSEKDIIKLITASFTGELDEEQHKILMDWVMEKAENKLFYEKICSEFVLGQRWKLYQKIDTESAIRKFDRRLGISSHTSFGYIRWMSIAAVLVLLIGVGGWFVWPEHVNPPLSEMAEVKVQPGGSKALLILAGGKQVQLEGQDSFQVSSLTGAQVVNKGRELVYQKNTSAVAEYNELRIPRGGEYRVVLSDGTVVRLNSGSVLKYPVAFSAQKREVELTGEACFEVIKDSVPFVVKVNDITVKVYGTVFNINAHSLECIQTALVEGKVGITVRQEKQEFMLKPQQLAEFNAYTLKMNIRQTDLTPYLAWTKGLFVFDNQTLENIMKTLSLWYNVDVVYQNPAVRGLHFTGSVERYDDISVILNALSLSVGVKFDQQGRILTIHY